MAKVLAARDRVEVLALIRDFNLFYSVFAVTLVARGAHRDLRSTFAEGLLLHFLNDAKLRLLHGFKIKF